MPKDEKTEFSVQDADSCTRLINNKESRKHYKQLAECMENTGSQPAWTYSRPSGAKCPFPVQNLPQIFNFANSYT
jgi:hypothetical protein